LSCTPNHEIAQVSKSHSVDAAGFRGKAAGAVIDSRRLWYFYHVARTGSFSIAETIVGVAQSAISRQVQQLESELQVQLLERHGRGVRLTPSGALLYERAESILAEMNSTLGALRDAGDRPQGRVSIAAFASVMMKVMPTIVTRYMERYPDVELTAIQASTGDVYDQLATGAVDVAILSQCPMSKKVARHKLLTEPMYLAVDRSHPIASAAEVDREELAALEMILPASQHGLRLTIEQYCRDGGVDLPVRLRIDSTPLTTRVLKDGRYCTILPELAFDADPLEASSLVRIPLRPRFARTLYVATLRNNADSPLVAALVGEVIAAFEQYRPGEAFESGATRRRKTATRQGRTA